MEYFFVFFFLLFVLFLSSIRISQQLFLLFLTLTKSKKAAIGGIALLFFPGVVVHELSHFLVATVLMVPTGTIEFLPHLSGEHLKLGSVQVAKTDPLRRFVIGVAPVVVGLLVVFTLLYYGTSSMVSSGAPVWMFVGLCYVLFVVTNTMFSSKKDMEGAVELVVALIGVFGILYVWGLRIPQEMIAWLVQPSVVSAMQYACLVLLLPLGLNGFVLLCSSVLLKKGVKG